MLTTAAILPLGIPELLIILLILVLIFGASKLPMLGKGLGQGIRNFKEGLKSDSDRLSEGQGKDDNV